MTRRPAKRTGKPAPLGKDARVNPDRAPRAKGARTRIGAAAVVIPNPPETPLPQRGQWRTAEAAVVGGAHLRATPPRPCQDAALADAGGRALAIVCDGAGSAPASHAGAIAAIAAIHRLCRTLETDIAAVLDRTTPEPGKMEALAQRIVAHATGTLADLGAAAFRDPADYRCTLLAWVSGTCRALWIKVGDGALIAAEGDKLRGVGPSGKGEFANQTRFLGASLTVADWNWGDIDSREITGFAAMSDGAAERLVATDGTSVANALAACLRALAAAEWGRREIFALLAEDALWRGTTGDDKSLALLART